MKRRTIITSVLVIVLCLGLISGSTFALFTSESSVNIAVTSGKVNVVATIDDTSLKVYSATADPTGLSQEELADVAGTLTGTFAGTYYYDKLDGTTFTNGGTVELTDTKTLKINKITPGDKVEVTVSVENNSNVKTKYRIRVNVLDGETLEDQAKSLKLFEGLTVNVGTNDAEPRTATKLNGVIRVSDWYDLAERGDNNNLADVPVEIFLPLEAGNEYQDLKTEIQITVEAVQNNAATNTELETINAFLATQTPTTMYAAVKSLADNSVLGLTSYAEAFAKVESYLWNVDTNQFYAESDATDFAYKYFKAYTYDEFDDLTAQTYSVYAYDDGTTSWTNQNVNVVVGFDAGVTTGIISVTYNRSSAEYGQDVVIRTNSAGTSLTINAPKDVVKHYGDVGTLNIIAAANASYHEFGKVAFAEISKGRMTIEEGAQVTNLHINSIKENDVTTNKFDSIIISIAENVQKPTFRRDDVEIATTGTLVVAIQNGTEDVTEETPLDYVWLTKQGIFEQIKVSDNSETIQNAKWADDDDFEDTNTQEAAFEIANNIGRDTVTKEIKVEVTVTNNFEEKTLKITLNDDRDLIVVDKEDQTEETLATISQDGEVEVNNTTYTIELSNNTNTKTTELVVTNQDDTTDVQKVAAIKESGLSDAEKESVKEEVVDNAIIEEISNDDNNAARIGTKAYESLSAAIEAAVDGDTIVLVGNVTENNSINKNITLDLAGYTITASDAKKAALTLYSLDNVTVKNGTINGQIRIGEHQYTIVKWKYAEGTSIYGYHPLAPAKNVILHDLTIASGNKVALYFTNIEDDLTRANESNAFDQDLYGHYIYKTGYQEKYEIVPSRDEIFTACEFKDHVTVTNCTISSNANLVGNMHDINNNLYTDVLEVKSGTFNNDTLGRFVSSDKYLVGTASNTYVVADFAPSTYTGRINKVYYTFEGGANKAIAYANFGETVYITENANVEKVFSEDENGNSDELIIYYEAENIAYTGATPYNPTYDIIDDIDTIPGAHRFYTKFLPVAAVYATGQGGNWKTANKVKECGTLQDAFTGLINDYTVVILKDFTVGDEQSYKYGGVYYNCAVGYATRSTIDFNGHVITYTGTGACFISSQQTGYLYFKDSSGTNAGGIIATGSGMCIRKENAKSDYTYIYGGTYVANNNNAVYLNGGCGVTIYGGVFQTNHATKSAIFSGAQISYEGKDKGTYNGPGLTISGGTYIAATNKDCITSWSRAGKVNVSGGTFTKAPSTSFIVSGKSAVDNGDGTWTVK